MPDPNMMFALKIADKLGNYPYGWLEHTIENPSHVAKIIIEINDVLVGGVILHRLTKDELGRRLNKIIDIATQYIYDREWIENGTNKTLCNVLLRLWSGCICGAKTIALGTRDGPTDKKMRARNVKKIRKISDKDPIFKAGVRASLDFKRLMLQPISFNGINPKDRREFFT